MPELIHDHTSYNAAFRNIASLHKLLHHGKNADGTANEKQKHFTRVVISRHPMLAAPDLDEFLKNTSGSGLKFPAMVLVAYTGGFKGSNIDASRKVFQGEFIILDRHGNEKWDEQEAKYTLTENIGEQVVAWLINHYEKKPADGFFQWAELETEKISISKGNLAGTKFYFTIDLHYSEGLTYNSDAFFEEEP